MRGKEQREAKATEQARDGALQQLRAAKRLLKAKQGRNSLVTFTQFTMPHQEDPDDVERSRYDPQYFHHALAAALEAVAKGEMQRLIITFPPRHGKSELTSRRFPAWLMGRDPYCNIILATYNQPFAEEFGKQVRGIIQGKAYKQVFPGVELAKGSAASDRIATEEGGQCVFVGRGGSSTGRGADVLIIDDPIKDRAEANSATIREEVWFWYQDTMSTRLMSDTGAIVIIQTRWHEDDLIGRLTDPTNPHYNEEEARQWKIINIQAIAGEDDVLGRQPGEALWPERFGIDWLEHRRQTNPVGFSALYQQKPTPEDGDFFRKEHMRKYRPQERPPREQLRVFAASDFAVGIKQEHDRTCHLIVGVDSQHNIWLLDAWWRKEETDKSVEAMIALQRKWKPLAWWAESGHISKSIGPFLRRRMREEKVYINIIEQVPSADKMTRAQSIQARASMGMVRFPIGTIWTEDAIMECLKFPSARHDDFVDALAHIGMGLDKMIKAPPIAEPRRRGPIVGTLGWVKHDASYRGRRSKVIKQLRGM